MVPIERAEVFLSDSILRGIEEGETATLELTSVLRIAVESSSIGDEALQAQNTTVKW